MSLLTLFKLEIRRVADKIDVGFLTKILRTLQQDLLVTYIQLSVL